MFLINRYWNAALHRPRVMHGVELRLAVRSLAGVRNDAGAGDDYPMAIGICQLQDPCPTALFRSAMDESRLG